MLCVNSRLRSLKRSRKSKNLDEAQRINFKVTLNYIVHNLPVMERDSERSLCLGSGIPFASLFLIIGLPNAFVLFVLYKDPLHCFRKPFTVFLFFIALVNVFNGVIVCSGETVVRFLCAFGSWRIPKEGDIITVLEYIGINSSILLMTAMSIDRLVAIAYPHFYLCKIKPRNLVLFNATVCVFSSIFASVQVTRISMDVYRFIDVYLHIALPIATMFVVYLKMFLILKKRSREDLKKHTITPATNPTLYSLRRLRIAKKEKKFAITTSLILLVLLLSLLPYFVANFIEAKCHKYRLQTWFFTFKESALVFLFLNSTVSPFLTAWRISELRESVKIVLRLRQRVDQSDFHLRSLTQERNNKIRSQASVTEEELREKMTT